MYHFIVNPKASCGRGRKVWELLHLRLKDSNASYTVYFTRRQGHATRLAELISTTKIPCTIVAVGGDGTANEVINGLKNHIHILFGYIPTGSGNDLARGLNLCTNPVQALDIILHPKKIRRLDIGIHESGGQHKNFLVSTGIGFDAAVCHEALHSSLKNTLNRFGLGKLTYGIIALKQLLLLKPSPMLLIMDGTKKHYYQKTYFIAAMNTRYEGGGFLFCPDASPSDEFLDLCVIENISKLKILALLPTALKGWHIHFKGVHTYRCRHASIQADIPLPVHSDGESSGFSSSVSLSLEKERLSFILA